MSSNTQELSDDEIERRLAALGCELVDPAHMLLESTNKDPDIDELMILLKQMGVDSAVLSQVGADEAGEKNTLQTYTFSRSPYGEGHMICQSVVLDGSEQMDDGWGGVGDGWGEATDSGTADSTAVSDTGIGEGVGCSKQMPIVLE